MKPEIFKIGRLSNLFPVIYWRSPNETKPEHLCIVFNIVFYWFVYGGRGCETAAQAIEP